MKKNGFISMTLVYSFLILFLFLMAGIIASYTEKSDYVDYINNEVEYDLANIKGSASTLLNKILNDNVSTDSSTLNIGSVAYSVIGNGNGLYYVEDATDATELKTDENGDGIGSRIYYFRGSATTNYAVIANADEEEKAFCFRIIRTNENGSVRMIYAGKASYARGSYSCNEKGSNAEGIGSSTYNNESNDNAFVGYMYGKPESVINTDGTNTIYFWQRTSGTSANHSRYQDTHNYYASDFTLEESGGEESEKNNNYKYFYEINHVPETKENESSVKKIVDEWYANNLLNIDSVIEDTPYCNDRSLLTGVGYGSETTTYNAMSNYSFACKQEQDRLTLSVYNGGSNSAVNSLIYPIALPTLSDLYYAGAGNDSSGSAVSNSSFYMRMKSSYWTMTPLSYNGGANVYYLTSDGKIKTDSVSNTHGIYPVISVKSTASVATGNGTYDKPYVIKVIPRDVSTATMNDAGELSETE